MIAHERVQVFVLAAVFVATATVGGMRQRFFCSALCLELRLFRWLGMQLYVQDVVVLVVNSHVASLVLLVGAGRWATREGCPLLLQLKKCSGCRTEELAGQPARTVHIAGCLMLHAHTEWKCVSVTIRSLGLQCTGGSSCSARHGTAVGCKGTQEVVHDARGRGE